MHSPIIRIHMNIIDTKWPTHIKPVASILITEHILILLSCFTILWLTVWTRPPWVHAKREQHKRQIYKKKKKNTRLQNGDCFRKCKLQTEAVTTILMSGWKVKNHFNWLWHLIGVISQRNVLLEKVGVVRKTHIYWSFGTIKRAVTPTKTLQV
jgi:hypothetical protein